MKVECSVCGKEFETPKKSESGLYYCSSQCYYQADQQNREFSGDKNYVS